MEQKQSHSSDHLVIGRRSVTNIVVGSVVLLFLAFVAGYFWGCKKTSDDLYALAHKKLFEDQVSASLYQQKRDRPTEVKQVELPEVKEAKENKKEKRYYAALLGSGSIKAAQSFIARVRARGYAVSLRKRRGKTVNGKEITWYQAITEPFSDEKQLEEVVARITKQEHLRGVKIHTLEEGS